MSSAPASGERAALRGYRWQYDHIAVRVYDALVEGDFDSLRLTDPEAGRVDDLVLIRRGRIDGYQFKSTEFGRYLTFHQFIADRHARGGNKIPSLLHSLAEGWNALQARHGDAYVHLVTQHLASINDHLADPDVAARPSPDHFSAFLTRVLEPLRHGAIKFDDIENGWKPALSRLERASGLKRKQFKRFVQSMHLVAGAVLNIPPSSSTRRSDIIALSDALSRRVSEASDVVVLDERGVLDLMGWQSRPRLRSRHEFPVDLDTYQPLAAAIEKLNDSIVRHDGGYVGVIGPPGSGKSTLLSQTLTSIGDRVVRYYAYVPGTASARTRLTATGFLHDVVVMLNANGLSSNERQLPGEDINKLRQQFTDQLDAAGAEFLNSGRRTIIVVDGLDHVDRDYSGSDGLLGELPNPDEIPEGVLFVVGSRMLAPLDASIRQQIAARQAAVDLQEYPLSSASVLDICRRAPVTKNLSPEIHQRIVQLSNGHPLALSYLLNRLREAGEESAEDTLAEVPAYENDIAAQYLKVWDECEDNDEIVDVLAVCSRLRISFTTGWISGWSSPSAVRMFRRKLLYLFRRHNDELLFFHDSFRQFVADRTALGDDRHQDEKLERQIHNRIAQLCAETDLPKYSSEQLYHRYCADEHEGVLQLAMQATFRKQYRERRSPQLVQDDISLALDVAADRGDVLVLLRLLLALVEVGQRMLSLEDVDMPGLLYSVGLHDEAIAWCGSDARHVSLAHTYELAARLQTDGNPVGRRLFEMVEHHGFGSRTRASGQDDPVATGWTRAAVLFRPLSAVISAIWNSVEIRSENDPRNRYRQTSQWRRYQRMFQVLIDTVVSRFDKSALTEIDSALAEHVAQLEEYRLQSESDRTREDNDDTANVNIAIVTDLRVRTQAALLERTTTAGVATLRLKHLLSTLSGVPLFHSTMLDAAEILARHNMSEQAASLLAEIPYKNALTVDSLGNNNDHDVINQHFRYWRLCYLLARSADEVSESVPPAGDTPAGNSVSRDAPLHKDVDAIALAGRIDAAVRELGRLDAAIVENQGVSSREAWIKLVAALDVFQPAHHRSRAHQHRLGSVRAKLMRIIIDVTCRYGDGLFERLIKLLAHRFKMQSGRWPVGLRLELADYLRSLGASVSWYEETLADYKASAASDSIGLKLDVTADLIRHYAQDGDTKTARQLVDALIPMAFGVGYRKDYQFDSWVSWIGRALAEPGGEQFIDDAAWLANVLAAAEPMTEGAPGTAATALPPAVVPTSPTAAVRIFEYLVRHGTVDHLDALAALVQALVANLGADDMLAVKLSADITTDLIARAGTRPYEKLAASLAAAAERAGEHADATNLAKSVAYRTDIYALPTTRNGWRRGLGLAASAEKYKGQDNAPVDSSTYEPLILSDGQKIAHDDVVTRIQTAEDVLSLRSKEATSSSFSWSSLIDQQHMTIHDVHSLIPVFHDQTRNSLEVLLSLARAAERLGDRETALCLARDVLRNARGDSWSRAFGGLRQYAAVMAVRLGDDNARLDACRNLARELGDSRWLPSLLIDELDSLIDVLDPGLSASAIWPEIRAYLDGIAESLDLPGPDVLADHGPLWWLTTPFVDRRDPGSDETSAAALAELAVGHLSHPTWVVRDGATAIVIRALCNNNRDVAGALAGFARTDASDDILERAGRCLAGARIHDGYDLPDVLQPLERALDSHQSQVLRDLGVGGLPRPYRPLSPLYRLTLPAPVDSLIGAESVRLAPHEWQYEFLANALGLDRDTLLAVAARYASEALAVLPEQEEILKALDAAQMRHVYSHRKIGASRVAFGRVLADLNDAGLLDDAPPRMQHLLRTVDVELLNSVPMPRPNVVPGPPPAGLGQTIDLWRDGIENRLEEYVASSEREDRVLIGADCRLTVLNWGHLEERLVCGTIAGTANPSEGNPLISLRSTILRDLVSKPAGRLPDSGESLVFVNSGLTFNQAHADWVSFRPDLAAALAWRPDLIRPGCWHSADGKLAVESIWWMDGWWGSGERAFNDTVAEGFAVILTPQGRADVSNKFGPTTRRFELTRSGLDDGTEVESVSASHSLSDIGANV